MKKFISMAFVANFLFSLAIVPANAYKPTFETKAKAAILYNNDTDTVVFSKDADERLYPASLTKIMVAVLFVEHCDNLQDLTLTVSEDIYLRYRYSDAVIAGFETGDKVNGYDLLAYTLVKSCADAAGMIAEYVAGSEAAFIDMMNTKAAEIGMGSTHFVNCHGLHDPDHYSTARDMCILTKYALRYSVITDVAKVARYETKDGITLAATNLLIDPSSDYYYKYATGFKTGFTDEAGRCLASTASYDGMTYICILLGCPAKENSLENRYEFLDSAEFYRWAFTNFSYRSVVDADETVDSLPIEYSWDYDTVNIRPEKEVYALIPNDADESTIELKTDYTVKKLEAPVKKGQRVGTVSVYYAGEKIGETGAVISESIKGSQLLRISTAVKKFLIKYKNWFIGATIVLVVAVIIFIAAVARLNSKRKKYGRVRKYRRF